MPVIKQTLSEGKVTVDFNVCFNKKAQVSTVEVVFPEATSSKFLQMLLLSFKNSKALSCSSALGVFVMQAVVGKNSIMFSALDAKIMNAVLAIYLYVHKMAIGIQMKKFVDTKNDNPQSLYPKLSHVKINVVGKCKSLFAHIESQTKKAKAFMTSMNAVHEKFEGKLKEFPVNIKVIDYPEHTYTFATNAAGNPETVMFYLSIILGDRDCMISKTTNGVIVKFLDCEHHSVLDVIKNDAKQCIKSWLGQFGAISDPKDDAKKVERVKEQLMALNAISGVICGLKGVKAPTFAKFSDVAVDMAAIATIKGLKEM
jgi:hypothetical protein